MLTQILTQILTQFKIKKQTNFNKFKKAKSKIAFCLFIKPNKMTKYKMRYKFRVNNSKLQHDNKNVCKLTRQLTMTIERLIVKNNITESFKMALFNHTGLTEILTMKDWLFRNKYMEIKFQVGMVELDFLDNKKTILIEFDFKDEFIQKLNLFKI